MGLNAQAITPERLAKMKEVTLYHMRENQGESGSGGWCTIYCLTTRIAEKRVREQVTSGRFFPMDALMDESRGKYFLSENGELKEIKVYTE
jgi:hypothetical protein